MSEYAAAIIQVGGKDLPADAAAQSALAIMTMRLTNPWAQITLWVHGYDDDPRELWDVPEVCEQVRQVVGRVLRAKPEWRLEDLNLDENSVCLLGMCCGILEITGRNPATGYYIMHKKDRATDG